MTSPPFNYLVTVHNKEALLSRVLAGVADCAGPGARIIIVLDGCTDGSENAARRFAASARTETLVLTTPDVHEIKTINAGLHAAKPGYCVILQDDVILEEPGLEPLVEALCERHNRQLGYLSFRLAANIRPAPLLRRLRVALWYGPAGLLPAAEECDLLGTPQEHMEVARTAYGEFHPRMVGIKSPVCLTPELRACEPYLDEDFAPYCYDDMDLSLRALKRGLRNGLFPIRFQSRVEWGGTRQDSAFSSRAGAAIRYRNSQRIWRKHGEYLARIRGSGTHRQ